MSNNTDLKFKFNNLNILKAKKILKKYPKKFSQSAIIPLLHLAQEQLDGWLNKSSIEYISNFENKKGIQQYENDFKSDFYSNKTSFGIHNDDYIFKINNELIKKFGSQGQQKLFIISLKIAEFFMLKFFSKKNPIILLDDVFDKLDDKRINLLLKYFDSNKFSQIFITDSLHSRIEKIKTINKKIKIINIKNGEINEG